MRILVTGGAGYIGSHTCLELLTAGHDVVVVDNLSNSSEVSLQRVQELAGRSLKFYRSDLRDRSALDNLFSSESIDAVIHFAGLKAVGESLAIPHEYYDNNVGGTLVLAEAMARHAVFSIIFSSSATVYGDPASVPAREDFPLSATNPYGRTKLMIEQILGDLAQADPRWNVSMLRYFNPVGAHESGRIGEDPRGIPNNLMPYLCQVAVGKRDCVQIFGDDYPTPDGTGVRDYVHVVDLALGHIAALERHDDAVGSRIYNLGTGRGVSVLELLRAVETASGTAVPYRVVDRRTGDIAENFADCSLAAQELGWTAERDLAQMAADSWRWQSNNPGGYPD
jgi:UDP-glucose 4-epimerase